MRRREQLTIRDLFLDGRLIDRALRRGVDKALLRHKQAWVAIAVWRAGKVVMVEPDQIKVGPDGTRHAPARQAIRPARRLRRA